MVDVRFELTTNDPWSVYVAICEGISSLGYCRLPKLSLITLSPHLNSGIRGVRTGPYVPTPKFFYNLWGPRESDLSDCWNEDTLFFEKCFHGGREIRLTTNDPWSVDDAICEGISPLGYLQKVNQSPIYPN